MIRKTRVLAQGGVMMVRIEIYEGRALRHTRFRVSTATLGETFSDSHLAETAFWSAVQAMRGPMRLDDAA